MTPERLLECMDALGWSRSTVARHVGRVKSTVHQWTTSQVVIPADVADWIERLMRYLDRNPPPRRDAA